MAFPLHMKWQHLTSLVSDAKLMQEACSGQLEGSPSQTP